jgi:GDPmannose 4,6-dehydratase
MKKAIITGITGQDGFYLAEFLKGKDYEIHGLSRRLTDFSEQNYIHHQVDLGDSWRLQNIIDRVQPDEIYNLGAMSNERQSYEIPEYTVNIDGLGVLRLLEAIRIQCPAARLFQASTSELFGKAVHQPQSENTPFHPRSPYGVAKLYAYWSIVNYREAYKLYACNGILFNHESPLRDKVFVTRKIVRAVVRIQKGLQEKLILGNLNTQKDWGFAKDYVEAMWLMLQQETPEDFVLTTGRLTSVRHFVVMAFEAAGITIEWQGKGLNEKGLNAKTKQVYVEVSPQFYRPDEGIPLIGDPSKAREKLKWSAKTTIEELISLMVEHEQNLT